ncbi:MULTISPECIES: DUF1206 domain-containing protein [Alteromonas]|uniref:DUF1206 domain-containing protein n=1 Tax=Alteromonas stellipolaris TaxID=233316 RepID=A0AAW7Z2I9_9ALTE|nr:MULTISPECIES: DUF1206 domain-containing protein [Alteromonas]AMJ92469.1 hypothetical protein AV940_19445 [Alteromonas sp. Mac2]AMJ88613.1 hypothetical protein AV939_19750 [Alteromonas sp. Mac1]AMJ96319.1 hypothetical protein AVL56_19690 [Alteromonas stellipolaris]ANB25458.1 hypothetical protein A6F57_09735 [Alteromonas stellipolaris]MDO6533470.1 DUF1206 domain-containing protein [Alteromonas stellipolaris]
MRDTSNWLSAVASAGYSAKTIMYSMLGLFILSSVITAADREKATQEQVFVTLKSQPFGQVLLGILIAGLVSYALWRWLQSILNTESLDMTKAKDIIMRVFLFVSGLFYFGAAFLGAKVLIGGHTGGSSSGGDSKGEQVSQQLMQYQWGIYLVAAIGVGILVFAFMQFKHAYKADFLKKFEQDKLTGHKRKTTTVVGRIGYFARGIVYLLVGSFFVVSAIQSDPSEAGGLQQALQTLTQQTFGLYMLAAVGVGFIMFGIYCGFEARYRRT